MKRINNYISELIRRNKKEQNRGEGVVVYPPITAAMEVVEPAGCTDLVAQTDNNGTVKEKEETGGDIRVVLCEGEYGLAKELTDDEKAVEIGEEEKMLDDVWERMKEPPTYRMGKIAGALDDRIFARVYVDEKDNRHVEFCQQYRDGSFSPVMGINQADMIMVATYQQVSMPEASVQKKIRRIETELNTEYLGKFGGAPEDLISVVEIIQLLFEKLKALPSYKNEDWELTRRELYRMVAGIIQTIPTQIVNDHDKYYVLMEEDITYLAKELGMNRLKMLRKFREYGFLYLQGSNDGYQANVRIKYQNGTKAERRYCIYRPERFAGIQETPKTNDYDF